MYEPPPIIEDQKQSPSSSSVTASPASPRLKTSTVCVGLFVFILVISQFPRASGVFFASSMIVVALAVLSNGHQRTSWEMKAGRSLKGPITATAIVSILFIVGVLVEWREGAEQTRIAAVGWMFGPVTILLLVLGIIWRIVKSRQSRGGVTDERYGVTFDANGGIPQHLVHSGSTPPRPGKTLALVLAIGCGTPLLLMTMCTASVFVETVVEIWKPPDVVAAERRAREALRPQSEERKENAIGERKLTIDDAMDYWEKQNGIKFTREERERGREVERMAKREGITFKEMEDRILEQMAKDKDDQ